MKIVCMIPARLGSQRVKNKNLKLLGDKPLIKHIIHSAKQVKYFDNIYINSESNKFKKLLRKKKFYFIKEKNF